MKDSGATDEDIALSIIREDKAAPGHMVAWAEYSESDFYTRAHHRLGVQDINIYLPGTSDSSCN